MVVLQIDPDTRCIDDGYVHKAAMLVERHRRPGMRTGPGWIDVFRARQIIALFGQYRAAGPRIDALRPGDERERLCRYQRTGLAIEHIKEAVLVRLHDDMAHRTIDRQIGQDEFLYCIEIPLVTRRGLIIPGHAAGVRIQGDDGGGKQMIALARAEQARIVGRRIAGAEIHQVQRRIIGGAIPHSAATE